MGNGADWVGWHDSRYGCEVDRRALGSWLTTPGQVPEMLDTREQDFRGQRLGLPQTGPGSIAPVSRRLVALAVDWASAMVVAAFFAGYGTDGYALLTLGIFAIQTTLLQWLMGSSFGQRLLHVAVVRVDGGRLGILPLALRTMMICLVIPAVIFDRDLRGLHDRAARTVCVRR